MQRAAAPVEYLQVRSVGRKRTQLRKLGLRFLPGPRSRIPCDADAEFALRRRLDAPHGRHEVPRRIPPARVADVCLRHHVIPSAAGNVLVELPGQLGIAGEQARDAIGLLVGCRAALRGVPAIQPRCNVHLVEVCAGFDRVENELEVRVAVLRWQGVADLLRHPGQRAVVGEHALGFVEVRSGCRCPERAAPVCAARCTECIASGIGRSPPPVPCRTVAPPRRADSPRVAAASSPAGSRRHRERS